MKVDLVATHGHYLANCRPIWDRLPDELRGDIYTSREVGEGRPLRDVRRSDNWVLCASINDAARKHGRAILTEHGVGQSYGGDEIATRNAAYAGGDQRDAVALFLAVNEYAAGRDRVRYPKAAVEIIGSPYLAELQAHTPTKHRGIPTVAITTHWNCPIAREAGSAWGPFRDAFAVLAHNPAYKTIGTAHPRIYREMIPHYQRMGIEPVEHLTDIIERADVVIFDNTSAGFLAAGVGTPVVVLDAPWWNPKVRHGGRFWTWADIGPRILPAIDDPDLNAEHLTGAVNRALTTVPWPGADTILEQIFPTIEDPAAHAAQIIAEYVKGRTP